MRKKNGRTSSGIMIMLQNKRNSSGITLQASTGRDKVFGVGLLLAEGFRECSDPSNDGNSHKCESYE